MDLSIITVTWNSGEIISRQVRSVKKACGDLEYEQIIIDNDSSDNTVDIVRSIENIKLIKNKKNKGFGAANNQGVELSSAKFILFLNPDMELREQGMLTKAVEWMRDNKEVGIMSCKLINKKGEINKFEGSRRFPKVWEQVALILKLPHLFPWILNKYHYKDLDLNKIQEVDSVRGSFMLVHHQVIEKLGRAFDPRYFNWFEDVDFCREVKTLGYRVIYNPEFECIDLVGQSFKQSDHIKRQKQFNKSMLQYFQKWEVWWKWIWIWLFRPVGAALIWFKQKL